MGFKSRASNKVFSLIVFLCISKVCGDELMCYVCDNCAHLTADSPVLECNEDFFHTGRSTASSVQTTKVSPTTTAAVTGTIAETTPSSINTEKPTTIMETTTTASKSSDATTKVTLNASVTTPSTPMPSENVIITKNNQSVAEHQQVNNDEMKDVENQQDNNDDNQQNSTETYEPRALSRQERSVNAATFYCFTVEIPAANRTMKVNRGCTRVEAGKFVSEEWVIHYPEEGIDNFYACSHNKCNGSSALHVSITVLVITVIAVFIQQK